jgi:hypothetical protein
MYTVCTPTHPHAVALGRTGDLKGGTNSGGEVDATGAQRERKEGRPGPLGQARSQDGLIQCGLRLSLDWWVSTVVQGHFMRPF